MRRARYYTGNRMHRQLGLAWAINVSHLFLALFFSAWVLLKVRMPMTCASLPI